MTLLISQARSLLTRRAFVGLSTLTAAGLLAGCGTKGSSSSASQDDPCPYNWANLRWEEGRPVYYGGDAVVSRWGVDVSEHQQRVDWEAVAAAGVQFAFVRIGNRRADRNL